ncbi:MAG: leucine-rich repeat protein, partial [Ruminococcus sp.]|nr:leucine-rich repeat protein [Ruminococcus sp.]
IPHSVTAILNSAFSGCTALTDFVISDSVTRIGSRSLENTAWLNRQPDGIVTVDGILYQYKDCPRFVRVDARVVAAGAFGGSETLEEVEIHEGVAYINAGAFADCPALVAAGFFSDACAIGDGAFLNSPQLVFYCSHNSTAHLYAKANNIPFRKVSGQIGDLRWVMEGTKLTVYGSGNIPSGNGPWHDDVTEIVLGKGVGSVGNSAFGNLSKLDKLVVQSRTTSFDAWTLPAGRKVGVYCYKGSEADKRLKPNVVHPITVTYLGEKGDANIDGAVNIGDATFLQMLLAEYGDRLLTADDPDVLAQGDMNDDGRLTVSDVTAIQRYLAEAATAG